MTIIQRHERNTAGRDFAVGDIHGHFTRLQKRLDEIGFDPEKDRLFSVGDLVDRGPECEKALDWLARPWFHAVRGNHEDIAIRYAKGNPVDQAIYSRNGGDWLMALDHVRQKEFGAAFDALPFAIEVETVGGTVGLVHANVPIADWQWLGEELLFNRHSRDRIMWDRGRIESEDRSVVENVRAVVVGHTPLRRPAVLGNVYHIDTGGWLPDGSGYFTLIDLRSLETMPAIPAKLEWEAAQ
ncbi:MAG: metallophosphoesterase [Burkholderiaceae bacterium]